MNMWYYCMNYHVNMYEHVVCVHWMDRAAAKEDSLKPQNLYDLGSLELYAFVMFLKVPFRSIQHVSVLPDVPWFHFFEMIWQEYDRSIEPTNSRLNSFSAIVKLFLLPKEPAKVKRQDAQLIMRESMEMEMAKVRQEWNCLSLSQQRWLIIEKGV